MTTRRSRDGAKDTGDTQSGTRSRSRSFAGSQTESPLLMMCDLYREADPVMLCRALCIVYDRRQRAGEQPGSDNMVHSTRRNRPLLVSEITAEWERIAGIEAKEDLFPYHESYVIRKWVQFRKQPDGVKASMIAEAKRLDG